MAKKKAAGFSTVSKIAGAFNQESEASKKLKEDLKSLKEENKALKEATIESAKAHEDKILSIKTESGAAQILADRVFQLAQKEKDLAATGADVTGVRLQMKAAIEQANEALGESVFNYQDEADAILASSNAVYAKIDAMREAAEQQAINERMIELAREELELNLQVEKALKARADAEELYAGKSETKIQRGKVVLTAYGKALKKIDDELDGLNAQLDENGKAVDDLSNIYVKSAEKQIDAEELVLTHAEKVLARQEEIAAERAAAEEELTVKLTEAANKQNMTLDEYKDKLKSIEEEEKKTFEERKKALETYIGAATEMYKKLEVDQSLAVDKMIENLEANQRTVAEWSENIGTLAGRNIDEGLLQHLRDAGPESAGIVKNLVEANQAELDRLSEIYANGTEVATEAMLKQLGLPENYQAAGRMVDNMANEIAKNKQVDISAKDLVIRAKKAALAQVKSSDFEEVGKNIADSVATGMSETQKRLDAVAESSAKATYTATKKANQMSSPSKLYRNGIGKNIITSIALGIKENAKLAINAMKMVSDDVSDAFSDIENVKISPLSADISIAREFTSNNAAFGERPAASGDVYITQNIQSVPQTPYEQAQQTAAAFRRARWA
jgi:hypothetical protein